MVPARTVVDLISSLTMIRTVKTETVFKIDFARIHRSQQVTANIHQKVPKPTSVFSSSGSSENDINKYTCLSTRSDVPYAEKLDPEEACIDMPLFSCSMIKVTAEPGQNVLYTIVFLVGSEIALNYVNAECINPQWNVGIKCQENLLFRTSSKRRLHITGTILRQASVGKP